MYLGSWNIDDYLTWPVNTHDPSDGSAADATGSPAYRIYEDETGTAILTGSMTKLDDANTIGFYTERIQLTAASGFERGKSYTIYISATVSGVTGTVSHTFQVGAAVDVRYLDGNGDAPLQQKRLLETAVFGTVAASSTTTVINTTGLSGTLANNRINGRTLYFLAGSSLEKEATAVEGYDNVTGQITVTALTIAPAAGDTFVII